MGAQPPHPMGPVGRVPRLQLWGTRGPSVFGPLQLLIVRLVVIVAGQYGELRALPPTFRLELRGR